MRVFILRFYGPDYCPYDYQERYPFAWYADEAWYVLRGEVKWEGAGLSEYRSITTFRVYGDLMKGHEPPSCDVIYLPIESRVSMAVSVTMEGAPPAVCLPPM